MKIDVGTFRHVAIVLFYCFVGLCVTYGTELLTELEDQNQLEQIKIWCQFINQASQLSNKIVTIMAAFLGIFYIRFHPGVRVDLG